MKKWSFKDVKSLAYGHRASELQNPEFRQSSCRALNSQSLNVPASHLEMWLWLTGRVRISRSGAWPEVCCISHRLPEDADAAGLWPMFWVTMLSTRKPHSLGWLCYLVCFAGSKVWHHAQLPGSHPLTNSWQRWYHVAFLSWWWLSKDLKWLKWIWGRLKDIR